MKKVFRVDTYGNGASYVVEMADPYSGRDVYRVMKDRRVLRWSTFYKKDEAIRWLLSYHLREIDYENQILDL